MGVSGGGTQRGLWGSRNDRACRRGMRQLVVRASSVAWGPSACLKQHSDTSQFIFC